MFTNDGRNLVARKLSGITDSCLDYLAIGIGGRPIPSTIGSVSDNSHQSQYMTQMEHEVLRVPIISTLPTTNGTVKCIAELPNDFNCEFTEVGIWTHRDNAGSSHPRTQVIAAFDTTEAWKYNGTTDISVVQSASGDADFAKHNVMAATVPAMYSPYNDLLWTMRPDRRTNKEGFRLSTHGILMGGDSSTLGTSFPLATPGSGSINLSVNGLPFDNAGPDDELRLSYFVASTGTTIPTTMRFLVMFKTSDNKYAKWSMRHEPASISMTTVTNSSQATISAASASLRNGDLVWNSSAMQYPSSFYYATGSDTTGSLSMIGGITRTGTVDINPVVWADTTVKSRNNGYFTQRTKLQNDTAANRTQIDYDAGFLWANVSEIFIYTRVNTSSSSSYYIGLDALSFVNTDTANPGYGLVAYDIAKNYPTRGVLTRQGSPTSVVFEVQVV